MLGLDNPLHILLVLVVVLLVFGAKRLPEMGKSLGEGLRGFKSSISDEHTDVPRPDSGDQPLSSLPAADAERDPQPVA